MHVKSQMAKNASNYINSNLMLTNTFLGAKDSTDCTSPVTVASDY